MSQKENIAKLKAGLTPLRPQWDARKLMWKIVKFTGRSWIRFGAGWYTTKEDAQENLDHIVYCDPSNYCNDTTT